MLIRFAMEHFLRPAMQFRLFNLNSKKKNKNKNKNSNMPFLLKGSTWFTVALNATVQQTQTDIFEMQHKKTSFLIGKRTNKVRSRSSLCLERGLWLAYLWCEDPDADELYGL